MITNLSDRLTINGIENKISEVRARIIANINSAVGDTIYDNIFFDDDDYPAFAEKNANGASLVYIVSISKGQNGKSPTAYITSDKKETAQPICVSQLDTDVIIDLLKSIYKKAEKEKHEDF